MLASVNTLVLTGIEASTVRVEVDIHTGLPAFEIVGLASTAIKEARERVRAAIKNSGFKFPNQKITVNLAPADLKKEGSHFDLAIALGIILASEQVETRIKSTYFLAGELSLNGDVKAVPGILPMVLELAQNYPQAEFIISTENKNEAALVPEIKSLYINNLAELCAYVQGELPLPSVQTAWVSFSHDAPALPDFNEVKGQETAKRALQIAAAGMHNILLIGPPGGGKTMLAHRIQGILPEMTRDEILETTRIYSVANLLNSNCPMIKMRPFRSPHKNASATSIIGGGRIPRPGEISLAQNGVLFLDEFPEFSRDVLEALRQPLEDRVVTISRTMATVTFPANFMLVASMNPCPCGNYGSALECNCTPLQIRRYLNRISGPLLDRMDLHVEVPRVDFHQLSQENSGESSAVIRERIKKAWEVQQQRFAGSPIKLNSQMQSRDIKKYCKLDKQSELLLKNAFEHMQMSARGYTKILKIARTIADLEQESHIKVQHVAEALQYRSLDKKYWYS